MALELVRVYAVDENSDPLVGVLVRVYDDTGTFVTQNYTALVGVEAYAEFTLDGDAVPVEYTIRMLKTGVAFDGSLGDDSKTPQVIGVYSPASLAPTGANSFSVQGQTFSRPAATDPRLCRASGFFRDMAGRPLKNLSIHFVNLFNPIIVDGAGVLGDKVWGRTDDDGYFVVDLFRNAEYRADVESLDIDQRVILVPDAASVNLVNLLFPTVASVAYDPDPVAVAVGAYVDVTVTIIDSTGRELDYVDGDVTFTIQDVNIASLSVVGDQLRITGASAGSTTIVATRDDDTLHVIPDIALATLSVTVS